MPPDEPVGVPAEQRPVQEQAFTHRRDDRIRFLATAPTRSRMSPGNNVLDVVR
ncbi:hypothetical protein GS584_19905 [Rhodococcus hoagii]|nr:hypothetical protein [Prescottella equi]